MQARPPFAYVPVYECLQRVNARMFRQIADMPGYRVTAESLFRR